MEPLLDATAVARLSASTADTVETAIGSDIAVVDSVLRDGEEDAGAQDNGLASTVESIFYDRASRWYRGLVVLTIALAWAA